MSESQTPRTDALKAQGIEWVPIGRMADIESELTATRARLAELEEKLKDNREREEATERELCRVSDVACDRAIKLAELEGIAEALLDNRQGSGFYTKEIAALKAYKKGKK